MKRSYSIFALFACVAFASVSFAAEKMEKMEKKDSKSAKTSSSKKSSSSAKKKMASGGEVFFTPKGKAFHLSEECSRLARSKEVNSSSKAEAEKKGLTLCKLCEKKMASAEKTSGKKSDKMDKMDKKKM